VRPRLGALCAGSLGGLLAVGAGVVGFVWEAARGGPLSTLSALTLALVTAAGAVALARPRVIEALVVADALLAISVLIEVFGRLGLLYLPSLVVLVVATMRAEERARVEQETEGSLLQPMLAWQEKLIANPPPAPVAIRDVPTGSAETLRRAG
jgi:cytochrome c oxidase subunit IV